MISLYKHKGKLREIQQIDGLVANSNFKSTYLADFFMDFENFHIFEEEMIPSRTLKKRIVTFRADKHNPEARKKIHAQEKKSMNDQDGLLSPRVLQ